NCNAITPTISPPIIILTNTGVRTFANKSSLLCNSFRNSAPNKPAAIPNKINHGNCVNFVNSNGGTVYHGLIPKMFLETVADTTEAQTIGAKRFIEKFPSTINEANTAPEIGAL